MKRFLFDGTQGLIPVKVLLNGPAGVTRLRLALDTGATQTVVRTAILVSLGFDPALASERVRITTASGVEYAPKVTTPRIEALGCERCDFPILGHTLPPSATVDGLLGLDFFRGTRLCIDFRVGHVEFG